MEGGFRRWDLEFGLALLCIFLSQCLDLRTALKNDRIDPPEFGHFTLMALGRMLPLMIMITSVLMFGNWIARGSTFYLVVFLAAVAAVDVIMQIRWLRFGRAQASDSDL